MRFFEQQEQADCLLAVTETILQKPRKEFLKLVKWEYCGNEKRCMSWTSFYAIIDYFKLKWGIVKRPKEGTGVVIVRYKNHKTTHALWYGNGRIYDPFGHKLYNTVEEYNAERGTHTVRCVEVTK